MNLFPILVQNVISRGLTKMAEAIITLKIMPESPDVNLDNLELKAKEKIIHFVREDATMKVSVEPVAFGLKAINIIFVMDEALGSPDPLAEEIEKFEEEAQKSATKIEIISIETREGVQLKEIGKVAAILRYPIQS